MSDTELPIIAGHITEALRATDDPMLEPTWLTWRVGRENGCEVYAQVGSQPSDDDVLIGTMQTSSIAVEAVDAHNTVLRDVQQI